MKTLKSLTLILTVLFALSYSAFSQTYTCDYNPPQRGTPMYWIMDNQYHRVWQHGFSGGVFQYVSGQGIDSNQPKAGITVYAVNTVTGETFYSVTDSYGIFGRMDTGGFDLYTGYVNQGEWSWYRLSDGQYYGYGLPRCETYNIIVGAGFFTPNPYIAYPDGLINGAKISIDSFGVY